jgi:diguanylate cyclase (GGDEF)-like protein
MVMGVVGYSVVLCHSEYWQSNMPTGVGLLLGLIILPCFYMVLIKRLHTLNNRLNEELEKTIYAATHDGMTGLANREYFFQKVNERIVEAERYNQKFAVIFIDLDGFKNINDSKGHHYGDELLKIVATRLQQVLRKSDVVARLGGDEFAIVLHEIDNNQIDGLAQRLLKILEEKISIDNQQLHVTASLGISQYPDNGQLAEKLIMAADTAMYQSKKAGKNQFTRCCVTES